MKYYPISFYNILKGLGYTGSIQEMLLRHYRDSSATGTTLDELEWDWLGDKGHTQNTLNERWFAYLLSQGLTGSLQDMFGQAISLGIVVPFSPTEVFAANEQGVWYEPSEFATLYQDSVGATPVTAVGQPVGLMLDKRKGLVPGPELMANGTFTTDTTGWNAVQSTLSVASGEMVVTATLADFSQAIYPIVLTTGEWYQVSVKVRRGTNAGTVRLAIWDGAAQITYGETNSLTNVTLPGIFQAKGTNCEIKITAFTTAIGQTSMADDVSIKVLAGNHAIQATAVNRPVVSARVNLLTGSEFQGGLASASVRGGLISLSAFPGVASNAGVAFGYDSGVTASFAYITTATAPPSTVCVLSVYVRMDDEAGPPVFGSASANNPLNDFYLIIGGSATGSPPTSYVVTDLGSQMYRVTATRTTGAADPNAANNGVLKNTGNSARTFRVTGFDFRVAGGAVSQPAYQRVNTATDYDTAGFLHYLAFNGTNSWMSTAAIDFTGTDKMTVVAGVRKLSDAAAGTVAEFSPSVNTNNGAFAIFAPLTAAGVLGARVRAAGAPTVFSDVTCAAPPAPSSAVMAASLNTATGAVEAVLRANTIGASSTTNSGDGAFGSHPLYIGARAGSSLFFNGNLYSLIIRGALTSAGDILDLETYVNSKTGAY